MKNLQAKLDGLKVIEESIISSEQFIKKCKGIDIEEGKFLAVFPDTMMAVGYGVNGIAFTETPYSLRQAEYFEKNVTNGHNHHPVVMTHREYVNKCIDMQIRHIDTMRELLEYNAL